VPHSVSIRPWIEVLWYLVDNLQSAIYDPSTRGLTPPEGVPLQSDPQKRPPATATIEMLRENSLATLAQRELERQIISGEIAVGTKLNEADIAGSLGVSRGPNEIYDVRAALEGLIGKLAAQRIDAEQVEQLRAVVKKMAAHDKTRKAEAYFVLNVEFHELLARAARNQALLNHYRRVVNELDLYRRETISRSTENIPVSTREHEAIVNAVSQRDEKLAERLLTEHVLQSRERLHKALARPRA
jgi:DNA-binding GntR family transcriptional regulator